METKADLSELVKAVQSSHKMLCYFNLNLTLEELTMISNKLKLAVLGVLSLASAQAMATGFVSLPTAGFSVTANSDFSGSLAGTTAWALCNTTGNFGSGTYTAPTTGANNTCAVFPSGGNNPGTPVSGFTNVALSTAKQSVDVTANGEVLAVMRQRVYRNSGATECIFEKRLQMNTTAGLSGKGAATYDYNPQLSGSQRLEVNDFTLGGFSQTATVSSGYYHSANTDSPVYRMGRVFTSVQMQSNTAGTSPATGYYKRPLNSPAPAASTEINGVGQTLTPPGNPTQAQQTAEIRTNWVDFVVDTTGGADEDNTTSQDSPFMYVRSGCGSGTEATAFPSVSNTVRIRQAGQETQPFVTILTGGVTRDGANANF